MWPQASQLRVCSEPSAREAQSREARGWRGAMTCRETPQGPAAGTAPVEGQEQGPQWGEEGLLDAGQAAVLGDSRV